MGQSKVPLVSATSTCVTSILLSVSFPSNVSKTNTLQTESEASISATFIFITAMFCRLVEWCRKIKTEVTFKRES